VNFSVRLRHRARTTFRISTELFPHYANGCDNRISDEKFPELYSSEAYGGAKNFRFTQLFWPRRGDTLLAEEPQQNPEATA